MTRRSFIAQSVAAGGVYAAAGVVKPAVSRAQERKADVIIENAKVITLELAQPAAEAIAIAGEKIVGVGARRDLESMRGAGTRVYDAEGRMLIPGLNDSHTHFIRAGLTYAQELRWDGVPSLTLALKMLKDQALRTPAPHWVQVVGGWTPYQFQERRLPTLDEINAATGDVPCFILLMYDRAFLNKAALRVLGWNRDVPEPVGGIIARDGSGQPTGLVIATTSLISLVSIFLRIPKLPPEDQVISTRHFMRELNRLGVTSLIDNGGSGLSYPDGYQAIAKLASEKALTVRIAYTLSAQRPGNEFDDYRTWLGQAKLYGGDDYFRVVAIGEIPVWAMLDNTNFAKDPVNPPPIMEEKLTEVIAYAAANKWPFRMHASFEHTAKRILGVLEKVHAQTPIDKLRWGLEHCEGISSYTLDRVAALGGSLGLQNRMSLDGEAFVAKWGKEAAEDAPAFGRIKASGVPFALGTDGNRATSHNPWVGIQWMVTGQTQGGLRHAADRNLMTREEALRGYSGSGAWTSGEEDKKGTLAVGKWADLAILSDDYMTIPENRISEISSVMTMVGGRVVHGEGKFAPAASAPLKVSPDWLPIGTYPGFQKSAFADGGVKLAASTIDMVTPEILAGDGGRYSLGCLCGLL